MAEAGEPRWVAAEKRFSERMVERYPESAQPVTRSSGSSAGAPCADEESVGAASAGGAAGGAAGGPIGVRSVPHQDVLESIDRIGVQVYYMSRSFRFRNGTK